MTITTLPRTTTLGGIDFSSDLRLTRTTTTLDALLASAPVGTGGWFDVHDIAGVDSTQGYALQLPRTSQVHTQHRSSSDVFVAVSLAPITRKRQLTAYMIATTNRVPLTARTYVGRQRDLLTVPQHSAGIHALSQITA